MEYHPDFPPAPSDAFLAPTHYFDFDTPEVAALAETASEGAHGPIDTAIRLYYAVRDGYRYDPFTVSLDKTPYRASSVIAAGRGFCIPKANLLVALARARGIPTALGLSDVTNHLSTERLRVLMGGNDVFLHHGYAVMYLEGSWVKAAPAFNIELCERFDVLPTEFDGRTHALFQPYDAQGRKHMEYLKDHGVWSDFPLERVTKDFQAAYPPAFFNAAS